MYTSIKAIQEANYTYSVKKERAFWFDKGAMSFFSTQIHPKVYKGCFFITSEQYEATEYGKTYLGFTDGPRKFSVRVCHVDGSIDTMGEHMAYNSVEEAEGVIAKLSV